MNVVLAVDVKGRPVAVLRAARDDGVVDGRDGSVVGSHAVHGRSPRERAVHDGVLAGFVGPNDVDAVVLVDGEIGCQILWSPELVIWVASISVSPRGEISSSTDGGCFASTQRTLPGVRANRCLLVG